MHPDHYGYANKDTFGYAYGPGGDHIIDEFGDPAHLPGYVGQRGRNGGKDSAKRSAHGAVSDASSDFDVPASKKGSSSKRRRLDNTSAPDIIDALERSIAADHIALAGSNFLSLEKANWNGLGQPHEDSLPGTSKSSRKRHGPKKRFDGSLPDRFDVFGMPNVGTCDSSDVTPAFSRPASPAGPISIIHELHETIPPLRRAKKADEAAAFKRIKTLEDAQRKVWTNIARRDVAKVG